jgi:hypothetical protein
VPIFAYFYLILPNLPTDKNQVVGGRGYIYEFTLKVAAYVGTFAFNERWPLCTPAYGAILGRNVRFFQIGRPYSFQTAADDSGQVTHMYVIMM